MTGTTPMKSLPDVQAWLATLAAGQQASVGSALFDPSAKIVKQLFALLPDSDPIALTVVSVDAAKAVLVGTGTVVDEPDTTATLQFSQPGADLLCALNLKLAPTVEWQLLSALGVSFGGLEAQFVPSADLGVVAMNFDATAKVGTGGGLAVPLALSVPSFDGDWIASAGEVKIGDLTTEALDAFPGGQDLAKILTGIADLSKFNLTGLELAFSPTAATWSLIRLGLEYDGQWSFFDGAFAVDSVNLDLEILPPLDAPAVQGTLYAEMQIDGGPPFDVGGQFPDDAVFAHLAAGSQLSVTNVFKFFGVDLPTGFPDIEISRLGFAIYVANDALDFYLGIDQPVKLIGDAQLDNFLFDITAAYDSATKQTTGTGTLASQFTIGQTVILLTGTYATGAGVTLAGHATDVPMGGLIAKLAAEFKVTEIPAPIQKLELKTIDLGVNTGAKTFTFACDATTTIAGVGVEFKPSIQVSDGDAGFNASFNGTLVLHTESGKNLTFSYAFIDGSKGTAITASFVDDAKDGLQFADIADALDLTVPPIPEGLELDLESVTFDYDFDTGVMGLAAKSKTYGSAALVVVKSPTATSFFFGLAIDRKLQLSDLPIIGPDIAKVVSVSVDEIQLLVASDIDAPTATKVNAEIAKLGTGYPQVPAAGMADVALAMVFDAGGDKTTLTLAAPPKSQARPATVDVLPAVGTSLPTASVGGAAPPPPPPSPSDGTAWLDLQKTFGPITFQKVGIRYRHSVLSFLMNASVSAGGLTIAVMGLGAGSPLTSFDLKFTIDGIAVTYAEGPVELSGALVGTLDPKVNFYGELILGVEELQIAALGGYTEVEGHPSFFLYAVLDYPIGGPAFFFVTGLAAGFGFNRKLVIPPVDGVATFPLVQWATGAGNPPSMDTTTIAETVTKTVTELSTSGVVAPSVGEDWLAVGVHFTSFELVDSFALLTAEFGTEFEIALLGLSTVQLPPSPAPAVAMAQLELEAAFIPSQGVLSVSGQLTPQSFVLSRDCHLTGGFALVTWFSGPHEGEFVTTIGGYSPHFTPPPYYPVVPRLGLNWQVTEQLQISGDLYFALTSSAVMAGGGLSAVWNSGSIRAWFDVEADFLLVFEPFHYFISAGIHLGASFTIDLWFTSLTVSIHLGVDLEIWGPEFAGKATIDLSIISFTITFGAGQAQTDTTIGWGEFLDKLIPSNSASSQPRASAALAAAAGGVADDPPHAVVQIVVQSGLVKRLSDADGELNWVVNGQTLQLVTQTAIPTKDWAFSSNVTLAADAPKTNREFGVGPVGVDSGDLDSTHTITITSTETSTFSASPVVRNVASALWQTRTFQNGVPVDVDPLNDTTIEGVGTGLTLTPVVTPPDHTLPIRIEDLQYTIADPIKALAWTDAVAPLADPFDGQTVWGTIGAPDPTSVRLAVLQAIAGDGWPVSTTIDVTELASLATYDLIASPVLRHLGEQR